MTTSRRSASSVEMSEPVPTASYAPDDGASIGAAFAANGSVYAKLFAKKAQVAVAETVEIHHELHEAHGVQSDGQYESTREGASNGGVAVENDRVEEAYGDEEDDEEYVPSEDGDSASEDEDTSDLEDEEMSMRGLLLPMATYARQLLFHETDDEFDAQDAQLWQTPEEKRAWIDRFEAANRAYEERFGCRIDSAAMPEVKRRLRRERRREAKYSLVLLAIAFAYMLRLWLGPRAEVVEPTPVSTQSSASVGTGQAWEDPAAPTWWTVWTEELVVRAVMWPRSVWTHFTQPVERHELAVTKEDTATTTPVIENEPAPMPTPSPEESNVERVVYESTIKGEPSVKIYEESVYVEVLEDSPEALASPTSQETDEEPTVKPSSHVVEVEVVEVMTEVVVVDKTEVVIDASLPIVTKGEVVESDQIDVIVELSTDVEQLKSDKVEVQEDEQTHSHGGDAEAPVEQCWMEFHKLIKTKRDPDVKVAAVSACDHAVEVTQDSSSQQWFDAHVMRGDLKSMLLQFADAQEDYQAALAQSPLSLIAQIEEKMMANLLVDLYQMKNGKQLVEICQEALRSSSQGIRELASLWTRVTKREVSVFEALKETRLRTISRLRFDSDARS